MTIPWSLFSSPLVGNTSRPLCRVLVVCPGTAPLPSAVHRTCRTSQPPTCFLVRYGIGSFIGTSGTPFCRPRFILDRDILRRSAFPTSLYVHSGFPECTCGLKNPFRRVRHAFLHRLPPGTKNKASQEVPFNCPHSLPTRPLRTFCPSVARLRHCEVSCPSCMDGQLRVTGSFKPMSNSRRGAIPTPPR